MMDGQKVVKVFCHEEENIEKFKEINNNLYESAYNANAFANVIGPINAQLGNMSYVVCAIVGGALALGNVGGFTLGGLASFLTFNKSFNMPINPGQPAVERNRYGTCRSRTYFPPDG